MGVALQIVAILVSLLLFWAGIKKLDTSNWIVTFLVVLDGLVLIALTILLGWLGIFLGIAAALVTILGYSIHLAMEQDRLITHAHTFTEASKEDLLALSKRLRRENRAVKVLGPIGCAELLKHLADCSRNVVEMEPMAVTIAKLWVAHSLEDETDLKTVVRKFDQLLRLWGKAADGSMSVANTLTAAAKHSPATFMEMLDGMIAVALGDCAA